MPPAVWVFVGVMVALTVVPMAITITDILKCGKDKKVVARIGQGNAHSHLRSQDIPTGIHIVPYGLGDHGERWAVSSPTLRTVLEANGRTHYVFGMRVS